MNSKSLTPGILQEALEFRQNKRMTNCNFCIVRFVWAEKTEINIRFRSTSELASINACGHHVLYQAIWFH